MPTRKYQKSGFGAKPFRPDTLQTGADAEGLACTYLVGRGLQVVDQNFRCSRGEIDLIMKHNRALVFVEVRARSNPRYGDGAESVSRSKQEKIQMAAATYLQRNPRYADMPCRFDVVSIALQDQPPTVEWIPDAFA